MRWAACASLVIFGGFDSALAQNACDRACLGGMLDRYLGAVVAHDPARAPLVAGPGRFRPPV